MGTEGVDKRGVDLEEGFDLAKVFGAGVWDKGVPARSFDFAQDELL